MWEGCSPSGRAVLLLDRLGRLRKPCASWTPLASLVRAGAALRGLRFPRVCEGRSVWEGQWSESLATALSFALLPLITAFYDSLTDR